MSKLEWRDKLTILAQGVSVRKYSPAALCRQIWPGVFIDLHQQDIIRSVIQGRYGLLQEIGIKGCTGSGKGCAIGIAANLWFELSETAKIVVTSVSYEKAVDVAFAEIIKWRRRMQVPTDGVIGKHQIAVNEEKWMRCINPATGEGFSGVHGENVLFWFDEACFDDQTEVMTDDGFKLFSELRGHEKLLSMDLESGLCTYSTPTKFTKFHRTGPMHLYEGRNANFCVTPNHDMLVWKKGNWQRKAMKDWPRQRNRPFKMPRIIKLIQEEIPQYTIPECSGGRRKWWPERTVRMDDWLEFLGWYLSEGHIAYGKVRPMRYGVAGYPMRIPYGVVITQKKSENRAAIAAFLKRLGLSFRESANDRGVHQFMVSSRQLAEHVYEVCGDRFEKRVPGIVRKCSRRQITIFLEAYTRGDGYRTKHGALAIYGSNEKMMMQLHELSVLCGEQATICKRSLKGQRKWVIDHFAEATRDNFILSRTVNARKMIDCRPNRVETIDYSGLVYCANVPPNNTLLTRRKGKVLWSGNSGTRSDYWDLAKTQAKTRIASSNPRVLSGWFFEMFPEAFRDKNKTFKLTSGAKRRIITVDAERCYNVCTGTNRLPGQITRETFAEIMAHPNPMWGQVFGHGRFPDEDLELQLIVRSWLGRHFRAWRKLKGQIDVEAFSLDVADSEQGDETVLAAGGREGVAAFHARQKHGTMGTVGWALRVAMKRYGIDLTLGEVPIVVDADGVGAGVASRLDEQGCWAVEHHGSEAAEEKANFANKRAEVWGTLARRLDPAGPFASTPWPMPMSDRLAMDLCAQERRFGSDPFRMALMPKEKPKTGGDDRCVRQKLGGRSPDRGDAAAMLWRATLMLMADEAAVIVKGDDLAVDPAEIDEEEKDFRRRKRDGKLRKGKSEFDRHLDDILEYYDDPQAATGRRSRWDDVDE